MSGETPAFADLGPGKGSAFLLNASGCLDPFTAPWIARSLDACVTKTVTPLARGGNVPARIAETEVGMLNSIGLANPGRARFLADHLPRLLELGVPIWVSVGGFSAADYGETCRLLDCCDGVAAIELNVSCPNVEASADAVEEIVSAARTATSRLLYTKLSPAVPDIAAVAAAAASAGTDGLSLVNTVRGLALDEQTLAPRLGSAFGGLSGPALKPLALAAVFAVRRVTALPIVGMGGVETGQDVLALVAAGANAVALGTVLFTDPGAPQRIRAELEAELAARGLTLSEAHGAAHRSPNLRLEVEASRPRKALQTPRNKRG